MAFEALRQIQGAAADELSSALESGRLPRSILISGGKGSGRLTGALDLAFAVAGGDREILRSGSVAYLAARPFRSRFEAAANLFLAQKNRRSRIFFIQTVRSILLQYHPSLSPLYKDKAGIKGNVDRKAFTRLGASPSIAEAASQLDEVLLSIEDDRDYGSAEIEAAVNAAMLLLTPEVMRCGRKTPGASIEEIRAIQEWLADGSEGKAVILENIEDYSEGAKNSLLKLLEEPPEGAWLILVSGSQSRIMETILSRVRKFQFPALSEKAVSGCIASMFSIYGRYRSFDAFFFEEGAGDEEKSQMERCLSVYSSALLEGRMLPNDEMEKLLSSLARIDGFGYFREELCGLVADRLADGSLSRVRARRIWDALSLYLGMSDSYNMSIRLALDYALREVSGV